MAIFKFTLPSGAQFKLEAPEGTTQAQADQTFYSQVAAGSFVGYEVGQSLTSIATEVTSFELSRLDRGTAGVPANVILGISQGVLVAGISQTIPGVVQGLPAIPVLPSLANVPLQNPITPADIVLIKGESLGPQSVGPLNDYQIQVLQAQIASLVDQEADVITQEKGIGTYGFTAYQLEQAGYVKPGTSARYFLATPDDFVSVMSSPTVWTGYNGVNSLDDMLNDPEVQTIAQGELMSSGYASLVSAGVIQPPPRPTARVSSGTVYTDAGVLALSGLSAIGAGLSNLKSISTGVFGTINSASTLLSNFNLNTSITALQNQLTGNIGTLVANASKFGPEVTALWAKSGSILSGLPSAAGLGLDKISASLTNLDISSIAGKFTNLTPVNLNSLTGSLDVFGKASQYASSLGIPNLNTLTAGLPNLNTLTAGLSGQLTGALGGLSGQLTGALSGQLAGLSGQFTGALAGLSGQLTGALSGQLAGLTGALGGLNLGSLGGLGAVAGLFGGGGDLVSGTKVAAGFTNTVNRKTVDAAVVRVLGNDKIPAPQFEFPSLASFADKLDISLATNFLRDARQQVDTRVANIPVFTQDQLNRVV
jgi:hypothetical protein